MIDKVHVYIYIHFALIKSTAGNKTTLFPSPFLISICRFLISAEAFQNNYVAACSTALRGAYERNELGGYVTVRCPSKTKQRSSTTDWLKFYRSNQIGYDGTHTEQIFTSKVTLCDNSCNNSCTLVDTVNLDLKFCTSHFKDVDFCTNLLH